MKVCKHLSALLCSCQKPDACISSCITIPGKGNIQIIKYYPMLIHYDYYQSFYIINSRNFTITGMYMIIYEYMVTELSRQDNKENVATQVFHPFKSHKQQIKNTIKAGGSTAICEMLSGWMDGVDTPQTVMTTRAPAVLKMSVYYIKSILTEISALDKIKGFCKKAKSSESNEHMGHTTDVQIRLRKKNDFNRNLMVYCCVIQRLVTSDGPDGIQNDPGHPDIQWG